MTTPLDHDGRREGRLGSLKSLGVQLAQDWSEGLVVLCGNDLEGLATLSTWLQVGLATRRQVTTQVDLNNPTLYVIDTQSGRPLFRGYRDQGALEESDQWTRVALEKGVWVIDANALSDVGVFGALEACTGRLVVAVMAGVSSQEVAQRLLGVFDEGSKKRARRRLERCVVGVVELSQRDGGRCQVERLSGRELSMVEVEGGQSGGAWELDWSYEYPFHLSRGGRISHQEFCEETGFDPSDDLHRAARVLGSQWYGGGISFDEASGSWLREEGSEAVQHNACPLCYLRYRACGPVRFSQSARRLVWDE